MRNGTAVSVGCAVGIPVGIGILIGLFFWVRLQQRFKQEELEDIDLQKEIYEYDVFINANKLSSLENGNNDSTTKDSLPDDVDTGLTESQDQKSKHFVPAYRRKINTISRRSRVEEPQLNYNQFENNSKSTLHSNSNPNSGKNNISFYEQMVPMISDDTLSYFNNDIKSNAFSDANIINTPISSNKLNFFRNESSSSVIVDSSSHIEPNTRNSSQLEFVNKLQNGGDLGSFFPRRASSLSTTNNPGFASSYSHSNNSQSSFHTRSSSLNSTKKPPPADNVFNTPTKVNKPTTTVENYQLQNNYDINNTNEIIEEDQYENDYTNYSKNKKEFIDSLRPKNN